MKTLIALTTLAIIALAIPAMAAEKPYEPKTKAEWLVWSQLQVDLAVMKATDEWQRYFSSLKKWNAVSAKGRAAEAKKVAEEKKAETEKKKAAEAKTPKKDGKDFAKEQPKAKQRH